jgi:hypothetical protein
MRLHLAGGESTRVQRQDFVVEAVEPTLTLSDQLGLETAVAVAGHLNIKLPRLGAHRLLARAVTAIGPIALLAHMRRVA